MFSNELIIVGEETFDRNKIWIGAKLDGQKNLQITMSNTGPEMSENDLDKLNKNQPVKKYDQSSGVELLHTLLSEFNLGEIHFTQNELNEKFVKFSVNITLQQWKNEK